jgi:hypothetical protein
VCEGKIPGGGSKMNMKKKFLLKSVKKGINIFKPMITPVIFIGFFIAVNANPLYPASVDAELIQHLSQTVKAGEMFALVEELSSGTFEADYVPDQFFFITLQPWICCI